MSTEEIRKIINLLEGVDNKKINEGIFGKRKKTLTDTSYDTHRDLMQNNPEYKSLVAQAAAAEAVGLSLESVHDVLEEFINCAKSIKKLSASQNNDERTSDDDFFWDEQSEYEEKLEESGFLLERLGELMLGFEDDDHRLYVGRDRFYSGKSDVNFTNTFRNLIDKMDGGQAIDPTGVKLLPELEEFMSYVEKEEDRYEKLQLSLEDASKKILDSTILSASVEKGVKKARW